MAEVKNPIHVADDNLANPHIPLWKTPLTYTWVVQCEPDLQDDMHYHKDQEHLFMVLEGECTVRTPRGEFVLKPFDTVFLGLNEVYQLCNTGGTRMRLLGVGNTVQGVKTTRVPPKPSHAPVAKPLIA